MRGLESAVSRVNKAFFCGDTVLRVLVVSHLWPREDWCHLGTFVSEQVAALSRRCDVSVAVPVDRTIRREELSPGQLLAGLSKYRRRRSPRLLPVEGITLRTVPFQGNILRERFASGTAKNLSSALSTELTDRPDLVHAHTVFPDGLACAYWLEEKKTPLVVTAHGSDVHSASPGVKKALEPLFRRADLLIPVSRFLAERLIEFGAPADKIRVIPNGFPDALFRDLDATAREVKKIAFLGRLDDVKRVDLLIRAMAHLPEEIQLEIAGDGSRRNQYQALTERLGVAHRVRFLGMLRRDKVPRFLSRAGVMCMVSRKEGWPTVLFEAMACGTPVIATAVGGIPEALEDTKLGTLLPLDLSPKELAQALEKAISTDWDREYIRKHAFSHSWDRIADQLCEHYENLIQARVSATTRV
jgi:glycosyltransferase involved in cell wall biosynthesis